MSTQRDPQPVRLLIADDHPAIVKGIASELSASTHLTVAATAVSFAQTLRTLAHTIIDMVILDIGSMGSSPLQMMDILARSYPMVSVIIYSSSIDLAPELLAAGARGYVAKDDPVAQLVAAITAVSHDESFVSDKVQAYLQRRTTTLHDITPAELIVLKLLAEGFNNQEIAAQIGVGPHTVQNRITVLRQKTLCHERVQLANWYRRMFYDTPDSTTPDTNSGLTEC
jgi:DNA-binding NarL/FixJ family response regulator